MTKRPKADSQKPLPQCDKIQVAGYPGTGGRMSSEWVAGYVGIRKWSMAKAKFAVIFGERFIRAMAA